MLALHHELAREAARHVDHRFLASNSDLGPFGEVFLMCTADVLRGWEAWAHGKRSLSRAFQRPQVSDSWRLSLPHAVLVTSLRHPFERFLDGVKGCWP